MAAPLIANGKIEVIVLGAGQDVGKSCIVVRIEDKTIMFDCGVHMSYNDNRKFPDFTQLAQYYANASSYDEVIDVVIISHFHLDHCGALPYFTERIGYNGKIIMTHPTKAICPILLQDWAKIQKIESRHDRRRKQDNTFTHEDVTNCMVKATGMSLHETLEISPGFTIKTYYAGHVLGAAMFLVTYKNKSVLYTGDYNMTPDRHLGAAECDRCRPDLLISESTYATMIRESRRIRERNFFTKVHECITKNGGKVLIPVFALGRAQELMLLLESYWDRMDLSIPIYFSAGLAEKANNYYKFFVNWCNESVKHSLIENERNVFDFPHIRKFDDTLVLDNKPCVLLATTGMLHAGTSLRMFKEWCDDPRNLVVLPGYCVGNTVGGQLLAGAKEINIDGKKYDVKMQVSNLSFSAHADMKGIMQLIRQASPKNVMLVHGEKKKMKSLQHKIECELALKCYTPSNGEYVTVEPWKYISINIDRKLLYGNQSNNENNKKGFLDKMRQVNQLKGHLVISKKPKMNIEFVDESKTNEICDLLNVSKHEVLFDLFCCFTPKHISKATNNMEASLQWLFDSLKRNLCNDYTVMKHNKCVEVYYEYNNFQKCKFDQKNEKKNVKKSSSANKGEMMDCVRVYIEKVKMSTSEYNKHREKTKSESDMDTDEDDEDDDLGNAQNVHTHEALRVRIVYPHNLTETACLVQSLINVTCDSYC